MGAVVEGKELSPGAASTTAAAAMASNEGGFTPVPLTFVPARFFGFSTGEGMPIWCVANDMIAVNRSIKQYCASGSKHACMLRACSRVHDATS